MPCLSSCTPHFVVQTLEVAQNQCNTEAAIGEHHAHTAFMSTGHPASMKSKASSALALRSLRALEVIGSDSDLVARSDLGCALGLAPSAASRHPQGTRLH